MTSPLTAAQNSLVVAVAIVTCLLAPGCASDTEGDDASTADAASEAGTPDAAGAGADAGTVTDTGTGGGNISGEDFGENKTYPDDLEGDCDVICFNANGMCETLIDSKAFFNECRAACVSTYKTNFDAGFDEDMKEAIDNSELCINNLPAPQCSKAMPCISWFWPSPSPWRFDEATDKARINCLERCEVLALCETDPKAGYAACMSACEAAPAAESVTACVVAAADCDARKACAAP